MALSISNMSAAIKSAIQTALGTSGGPELTKLCDAIATGVVNTSIGLTGQIGSPSGIGTSSGTGITGITGSGIGSAIETKGLTFWSPLGVKFADIAEAIGDGVVADFANATLGSDANGTAAFTSFAGAKTSMATAIENAEATFTGSEWGDFCTAVADGICTDVDANGIGTLSGAPGGGPGTGVVTIA